VQTSKFICKRTRVAELAATAAPELRNKVPFTFERSFDAVDAAIPRLGIFRARFRRFSLAKSVTSIFASVSFRVFAAQEHSAGHFSSVLFSSCVHPFSEVTLTTGLVLGTRRRFKVTRIDR